MMMPYYTIMYNIRSKTDCCMAGSTVKTQNRRRITEVKPHNNTKRQRKPVTKGKDLWAAAEGLVVALMRVGAVCKMS